MQEDTKFNKNSGQTGEVSQKETTVIFLIVLSIIPWAFVWMSYLAPAFGLAGISWKLNIFFVVGGPGLLWTVVWWLFFQKV